MMLLEILGIIIIIIAITISVIIASIIIVITILTVIHIRVKYGRIGKITDRLPGPPTLPILGNGLEYIKRHADIWPFVLENKAKYGYLHRIWAITCPIITILHPNDIEIILSSNKHIEKSIVYDFLHLWLGTGLLTSKGTKWHQRRKILTPAFHFNILQKYMEVILEHGAKMVASKKSGNEPVIVDIGKFVTKYTLSTICETAMGTPLTDTDNKTQKYREAVLLVGQQVAKRFMTLFDIPDWFYYNFIPSGRREKRSIQMLNDFSLKIIRERKLYHEKTDGKYLLDAQSIASKDNAENDGAHVNSAKFKKKRLAMLDLLITAEKDGLIDDVGILEEVNTFIFEGNDTTSAGLTYILQLLSEFVDAQQKAREEIDEVWKTCNGKFTIADINKLSYLERCIKESLRLFPSVPYVSRYLNEDLQLSNDLLPKGACIQIMIYVLHRDPQFWSNPDKFDPDRFLPENSVGRHPFSYIPFSAGPRNCIGQKFAMLEMKTICAYLLHNFRLEAQRSCMEHLEIKPDLVMRSFKPYFVKLIPINNKLP